MQHDAIVFDLDGTLLDTLEDLAASMNAVLAEQGHPTHPVAAYRHFVGDGIRTLVARASPPEVDLDAGVAAMRTAYGLRWRDRTRPYPGVEALLDALAARGVPFAILSNKPHDFTVQTVEALLGRWPFREVWGVGPGVPPKPDPAGALALAAALDVRPDRVLYVGDTNTDMRTAVAAGMDPIGVLWGFRDAAELEASGARVLVNEPGGLLELL